MKLRRGLLLSPRPPYPSSLIVMCDNPPQRSQNELNSKDGSLFRDLRESDPRAMVDGFIRSNSSVTTTAISSFLTTMNSDGQRGLIQQLINTLVDSEFRDRLTLALKLHIQNHPWQTEFFVVGIVLMCNPLAIAGFGSLGPVAGKLRHFDARYVTV
jgi:hypothetical protein